jgi:hypothetical protein
MRTIREGDVVTILWANGHEILDATVLHTPSDTGDLWYLDFMDVNGKLVDIAVNPTSANFDCFIKPKEQGDDAETV